MSHSNHFLAILPLFAILSISPMQLDSHQTHGRTIASEVVLGHPKYEARALKIDRTKIVIDKDLDLDCLNDRQEAYRKRLLEVRDDYKVELIEKDAVSLQRGKIETLVSSLVELEEEEKVLKDKKVLKEANEKKSNIAMSEFKTILEGLLKDEIENELIGLKAEAKKEEVVAAKPDKPKADAEKPAKVETKKDDAICDLEAKNLVLTKQVEELLAQQKNIMQTMLGMTQLMVQMNQKQNPIQPWMMDGSMMNQTQQYPTQPSQGSGQWVYYPQTMMPMVANTMSPPQLGEQTYQQAAQSNLSYLPLPMSAPVMPGSFGQNTNSFNFSPSTGLATNNFATSFGV